MNQYFISYKDKIIQFWQLRLWPTFQQYRFAILSVTAGVALFFYFGISMGWFRAPLSDINAFEAVPPNVTWVFETQNYYHVREKLAKSQYSNSLRALDLIDRWANDLNNLDASFSLSPRHKDLIGQARIVSAAQLNGADFEWLHIFKDFGKSIALNQFFKIANLEAKAESVYRGQRIYQVIDPNKIQWAFCKYGSILLVSHLPLMLESAIDQLENISGNLPREADFSQLMGQTGSGDLSVYVNFNTIPLFLSATTPSTPPDLDAFSDIFSWAGLDLRIQEKNMVLSGHLYPNAEQTYWKWMAKQNPVEGIRIGELIPENMALCAYFCTENFGDYYRKLPKEGQEDDFSKYILPWLGAETAFLLTEPTSSDFMADKMVVVKAKDIELAKKLLGEYSQSFGLLDKRTYRNYNLQQISSSDLFKPVFGTYFKALKNPYYIIQGNYVVFCNSASVLQLWIENFLSGKMAAQSPVFKPFLGQLKDKSSVFLLLNTPNAAQLMKAYLRPEFQKAFDERFLQFHNLTPIGVQLTAFQGHFLMTVSVAKNSVVSALKTNVAWRTELKAAVVNRPFIVKNHLNKQNEVFVQDVENRIYLLSRSGQILWEKPVDGRILSEVQQIDYFENGKLQYVFNTAKSIYIVDRNGDFVKRIELVSTAANGVLAIDYGKGPRLFIACKNGNVYGYDKNGKPLIGWNPHTEIGAVQLPLKYIQVEDKEIIVAMNRTGKLHFLNRDGSFASKSSNLEGYYLSDFYFDKSLNRIVAGASNGKIRVSNIKGKEFGLAAVGGINKETRFFYADIVGDERKDFVRLSKNRLALHYYDSTNQIKEAFFYSFDVDQDDVFEINLIKNKKAYIGCYSKDRQSLYILDAEGKILSGFPLGGTSRFEVLDLFEDNTNALLVANGKQVLVYKLKL